MKKKALFFASVICALVVSSCSVSPGNDVPVNVDNAQVDPDQSKALPDESISLYGKWSVCCMGRYHAEGGETYVTSLPPAAISPISQAHYLAISEEEIVSLILVSPIGVNDGNHDNDNVFVGDKRLIRWSAYPDNIETDLLMGRILSGELYAATEDSLSFLIECDEVRGYDPLLVFKRIKDDVWKDALSRSIESGTAEYYELMDNYSKYFTEELHYPEGTFRLNQYLYWY